MSNPIQVAKAVFAAYEAKDRDALERIIAPDFHFFSPLDNAIDRQRYFDLCWPNSRNIERFEFIALAEDSGRVFVTYEATVRGGKRFRNTEVLTVRNGFVVQVEVYFGWNIPHPVGPGEHGNAPG